MQISSETRGARELAELAANGEIVIPRFQRDFVWGARDIRDLLVSVLNGYYVGSLLFLRIQDPDQPMFAYEPIKGSEDFQKHSPVYLVLDGQQRVTALFYALYGPDIPTRGRTTPVKFILDFKKIAEGNIEDAVLALPQREAQKYYNEKSQYENLMIPCTELLEWDTWFQKYIEYTTVHKDLVDLKKEVKKAREVIRKNLLSKEDFEVPIWQLQADTDPADVCSIFEKINNTGKALTIFELVHARLYKADIDLAHMWEDAVRKYSNIRDFNQENSKLAEDVLRLLCLLSNRKCNRANLINLDAKTVNENWAKSAKYFEKAIARLIEVACGGYGVIDSKWLPYAPMVPPLACLLSYIDEAKIQDSSSLAKIHRWYWLSVFGERYGGATPTTMYNDSISIKNWLADNIVPEELAYLSLGDLNLRLHYTQGSAIYKAVMCLSSLKGAKDFFLDESIRLSERQDHHIFPHNYLKQQGYDEKKGKTQMNNIINRTLISDKTNNIIKDKAPSVYLNLMLQKLGGVQKMKEVLDSHFINEAAYEAMKNNDYDAFLAAREKSITAEIKSKCGILK